MSRKRPPLSVDTFLANRNSDGRTFDAKSSANHSDCGSKSGEPDSGSSRVSAHEAIDLNVRLFKESDPHIKALERLYLQAYYGPGSPNQLTNSPSPTSSQFTCARPTSTHTHADSEKSLGFGGSDKTDRPIIKVRRPTPDQALESDDSGSASCNDIASRIATPDGVVQLSHEAPSKHSKVAPVSNTAVEDSVRTRGANISAEAPTLAATKSCKLASPRANPLQPLPHTLIQPVPSNPMFGGQVMKIRRKSVRSNSSKSAPEIQMSSSPYQSPASSFEISPDSASPSTPQTTDNGSPSDEVLRRRSTRQEPYAAQKVIRCPTMSDI